MKVKLLEDIEAPGAVSFRKGDIVYVLHNSVNGNPWLNIRNIKYEEIGEEWSELEEILDRHK